MPIEIKCTGCGRLLRVADEHRGKQARCPMCNSIFPVTEPANVPTVSEPEDVQSSPTPALNWFMKTPEGQTYGPVSPSELDRWVSEGRVTADCQLRSENSVNWQSADQRYSVLRSSPTADASRRNPFANSSAESDFYRRSETVAAAYHRGTGHAYSQSRPAYVVPHRGGLILALGILGWVTCPILSVMAWVMGSSDLREMRSGRMDPSGMGLTQAGQVLGIIYTIFWILGFVLLLFFILLGVAANAVA